MKKLILTLVGMVCMTVVMADDVYPYLTFECSDGSTNTIGVKNLTMNTSDNSLVASNDQETKTFTLSDLTKMYFSGSTTTTTLKGDVNRDGTISVSDVMAAVNIVLGNDYEKPYIFDHLAADPNYDGRISIADVMAIVQMVLD